ncbi:hypothetical protein DSM106972_057210 [Dulcicalothrix desertica PCC 7102]|uniref:Transmembrane protein n=1 Tax=Dulcicalothrix desertica PCC 7102 TaxID=232991 RepID=A0A433V9M5_9CYAN|nr:hypothetical protein [Dulcicalothrix desertica]RUT02801.1 hypothetical protein DSM106972_057210 [Dulcicalothrix desertica PCC 7102]TWH38965.1 hypothetical protein CAL7102_08168 [Dulcicalothrix desertica PCC 7102]
MSRAKNAISNPRFTQYPKLITQSIFHTLNGRWHKPAMQVFMVIIITHLLEHIFQVYQVYVLGWSRKDALGALGLLYPWLVRSEWLHYGHALFMLLGLAALRPAIVGRARIWWDITFVIAFYHHFEHALLLGQVLINKNLFGSPVPTSIGQLWIPRLELHLFYNALVLLPMLIALYYHRFPSDFGQNNC